MVRIGNEDCCNERPLHCEVACVLHCSALPRKIIAFSVCQHHSWHIVFIKLRFFLIRLLYLEALKVVRASKLLLDILCSKFSRLLNGMYADC